VPETWFKETEGMAVRHLPTHFGDLGFVYKYQAGEGILDLSENARPPGGFMLRLPKASAMAVFAANHAIQPAAKGDVMLPAGTKRVTIKFSN
jgi:hypothetical protein